MCGIVGYVGPRQGTEVVLAGLHKLEYRGYDSAGGVTSCSEASRRRAEGKLRNLEETIQLNP